MNGDQQWFDWRATVELTRSPGGSIHIEVLFEDETFWLSQRRMAELFGVNIPTINHHLREIFESGELVREATIRKFRIVQTEGGREAARQIHMRMADWITKLDGFLRPNDYDVLSHPNTVSAAVARQLAEGHYETFRVEQDRNFESDFDREVKRIAPFPKDRKDSDA